ncbi:hypothetical protein [Streptomyces sp. NPDC088557]|uniref:hypothetical protein n=1 Tax=Streptomyces sp. NPDC088557 TaxID=3365867 RepID=UPI003821477A
MINCKAFDTGQSTPLEQLAETSASDPHHAARAWHVFPLDGGDYLPVNAVAGPPANIAGTSKDTGVTLKPFPLQDDETTRLRKDPARAPPTRPAPGAADGGTTPRSATASGA